MTGHWSSIGIVEHDYGVTLDSGCVWGGKLTAFNLNTKEIKSVNADPRDLT
jgi:bis(5'-nucleosyl)-tetraphosphatase (symmetrical)